MSHKTKYRKRFHTNIILLLGFFVLLTGFVTVLSQNNQEDSHLANLISANQEFDENLLSIQFSNVTIQDGLEILAGKINVGFSYNPDDLPNKRVSFSMTNVAGHEVIYKLLEGTNLEPVLPPTRDVIIIRKKEPGVQMDIIQETVRGTVVDAQTGEVLPGVNVVIEGTSIGTTTNAEGQFELDVPDLQETLIFTYIGYERQEVNIEGRERLEIQLQSELYDLGDELVVVGYGTMQRSDISGSVYSVDRRDITELGSYSMDNVLQGRIPGLTVSASGFSPGETSSLRIRGSRSLIASNDPLIVMDGIPIEGGLMELNPSDVESVEVLKDASATAIYGSRGANGVILITTRQGFDGFQVEYRGHAGPQWVNNRLEMMDTETYAQFARDAYIARDGTAPPDEEIFDSWALEAIQQGRSTDWQDLVFGRGHQQTHQLSVLGGTETTRYNISGTFDEHFSPVRNNDYRRITGRINLDQQISNRVRFGISSHISNTLRHNSVSFARVLRNSPMSNPYDDEGNIRMYDDLADRNPLFDMQRENNLDQRERTRIIASVYAEIDLIQDRLTYRGMFSPDFRFRNDGQYTRDEPFSEATANERRQTSLLYENRLNYTENFRGIHRLDITAMNSYQTVDSRQLRADVMGLVSDHHLYHNIGTASHWDNLTSSLSEWKLESYMLRTNYVYDDRYVVTLTGRVDGSSRLSEGNEYAFFPSGAIAWNITNESFMQNQGTFNELRLRLSVGETGNTAISPYQTLGQLAWVEDSRGSPHTAPGYSFGGDTYRFYEHGDIPNPDLRWERSRTYNLGLDWGIMGDRFQGSIEAYQTETYDLLMNRMLPYTSGYSSALENIGETQNRGMEFNISSTNIHTQDWMWQTDINVAYNRNKIVSLYGGFEDDVGSGWFIGEPMSVIYYWDWDGIWQLNEAEEAAKYGAEPGDVRVIDQNGDGVIDGDDRVIRGDPFPNWTGGLTNRLSYRNIDFSIFIYASYGSTHYSATHSASFNDLLSLQFVPAQINQMDVDYWMPDNPSNTYERPRFDSQQRTNIQAYFDSSFLRVRNIQLGYSLPAGLLSQIGLRNARFYMMIENPVTFTSFPGYDPEGARSYDHPNYTTVYGGLELTF